MESSQSLASEQFCYLTTVGRRTGKAHTIEIWFATPTGGHKLYMLSGGGHAADWVKNIERNPAVEVRIAGRTFTGRGRIVLDVKEDGEARKLVVAKYYGRQEVAQTGWEATSLPVAVDLDLDVQG